MRAAVVDEKIYVIGGFDGKARLKSVERYDPRVGMPSSIHTHSIRMHSHNKLVLRQLSRAHKKNISLSLIS